MDPQLASNLLVGVAVLLGGWQLVATERADGVAAEPLGDAVLVELKAWEQGFSSAQKLCRQTAQSSPSRERPAVTSVRLCRVAGISSYRVAIREQALHSILLTLDT